MASRRCTTPAAEPDDDDVRLGVGRRQRQRLATGRRRRRERRQRGEAEAEERAAIEVHACHYGPAPPQVPRAARSGREHEHAGVVAQGASWTCPTASRTAAAAAVADGAASSPGAVQAVLAEGVGARGGALEHAVGDEDDELVGGDLRPPGSRGGCRRSSPRTGPSPPCSARSPRSACQTIGGGCPQRSHDSDEDGTSHAASTALMKIS